MTKKIEISKLQIKKLVSVAGFERVSKSIGSKSVITLRARLSGHLKLTEDYKYKLLKALESLGVYKDILQSVKLAKKKVQEVERNG